MIQITSDGRVEICLTIFMDVNLYILTIFMDVNLYMNWKELRQPGQATLRNYLFSTHSFD